MSEAIVRTKCSSPSPPRDGRKPVTAPPSSSGGERRADLVRGGGRRLGLSQPRLQRADHAAHLYVVGADRCAQLVDGQHARVRGVAQALEAVLLVVLPDEVGDRQPPTGPQATAQLGDRDLRLLEVMDRQARDDHVEARVEERQRARVAPHEDDVRGASARPCSSIATVASSATTARTAGASRLATWPVPAATSSTRSSAVSGNRSKSHSESVVKRRLKRGSSNAAACWVNAFVTASECESAMRAARCATQGSTSARPSWPGTAFAMLQPHEFFVSEVRTTFRKLR